MLVKKELAAVPASHFPKLSPRERGEYSYRAAAKVVDLPRSGRVLVVDVFEEKARTLLLRFFSDGSGHISHHLEPGAWTTRKVQNVLGFNYSEAVGSTKGSQELVQKFLHADGWWGRSSLLSVVDSFISGKYALKQQRKTEAKYKNMHKHFKMFPALPRGAIGFCERRVFPRTYIFIGADDSGKRTATCGGCGHTFDLPAGARHKAETTCPHCKRKALYYAERYERNIREKSSVCFCHRVKGQLLMRWYWVVRVFKDHKPVYDFYDYFYRLYLVENGKAKIYSYFYHYVMTWGWDWYRVSYPNNRSSYVYTGNLRRVFQEKMYNVDIPAMLAAHNGPVDLVGILDNLQDYPITEQLVKCGLLRLASQIHQAGPKPGQSMAEVLGVSRAHLPLYRELDISYSDHELVKMAGQPLDRGQFYELKRRAKYAERDRTLRLLDSMGIRKFTSYFDRQLAELPEGYKATQPFQWYDDYIAMSEEMGVDLSAKSVRYPRNLKEAHDRLSRRYAKVADEIHDENIRTAKERIAGELRTYTDGMYCIVMPESRKDFIREGQSLDHCVGCTGYYERHIAGERMIFFIRRAEEPDKPFVTMELDMRCLKIGHCYGLHDLPPAPDVRRFAQGYVNKLKPKRRQWLKEIAA